MAKKKILFECQHCGLTTPKWMGKCTNCGAWDSFIELSEHQQEVVKNSKSASSSATKAISINEIEENEIYRYSSLDKELDGVLGGGIVPGSLTLIGGSPGVGKSTLLLKVGANIASLGKNVLYVTGEESAGQIKLRANRLQANIDTLYLLSEIRLGQVLVELEHRAYEFIIIDSIQTLYSEDISSAPGSVTQVRQITFELMRIAKEKEIAIFIIGHITKEGSIAGPRVLEHMVDTVLYFEGDSSQELRILRGFKNRFGPTSEIGVFEMRSDGLVSATDVASRFFNRNSEQPGSALTVVMEGSRPIILEVQALVSESHTSNSKRQATGFDNNRLNMLLALLERKLEIPLSGYDVFINITGGIKITETAADLAILAAIISSFRNRVISKETVFIGEVSLVGDVREVYAMDVRLKEAKMQNISKVLLAKKPLEKTTLKTFIVDEVTKLIEWY
ncbi:MAG: DNA repair protein RadA [Epsilonproteobacteria bacterium]|nr:DNA repair protein RadA [Campylobacterota bacterium]OIO13445.1 MAG: DNA repair protein RadA [Helicobacteraceae bacterium CG1_02_36_14]PIP11214.1 MAG: DNA repair protein RadA [Sulfurimonas sp. CG23_combo_of_CG06-09_8_20_14_all_36_33]PIS25882.1 MAG: DNA repair protein RadA [Sulfurimonas sp. CG08_land_8_20_14_0_20_36_33]PIU33676.1 MAG: DNA repair protein RadA [Sulfurimonas sp. CG07_land_8_20_14_0_80_36_56]PIV05697.1 MAG: DNA repair protein RadA [Sulfurimonas sp. CG03_land_8_20_14_0_80_36_25]P